MTITILNGDVRAILPTMADESIDCVVTSPPYWGLRDYGVEGQIGLETTLPSYLDEMTAVCRGLRRVLKPRGTFWLNVGDSYAGSWGAQSRGSETRGTLDGSSMISARQILAHPKTKGTGSSKRTPGLKPKDLSMVPNRLAIRLQEDGWYVRSEIIWHKPNPMPESVKDRPTSSHEKIWLLTKSERYFYDAEAVKEPDVAGHKSGNGYARVDTKNVGVRLSYGGRGQSEQWEPGGGRNLRNVWTIATKPFVGAHFATFPPELAERCIKAGCPVGGLVLDPFGGAGTTGLVADRLGRNATLIELNPDYVDIAHKRISDDAPLFADIANDDTKERAIAAA